MSPKLLDIIFSTPKPPSWRKSLFQSFKYPIAVLGWGGSGLLAGILLIYWQPPSKFWAYIAAAVLFGLLIQFLVVYLRDVKDVCEHLHQAVRYFRNVVLVNSFIDPSKFSETKIVPISGISELDGTVALTIKLPHCNALRVSSILKVYDDFERLELGTVQVVEKSDFSALAQPIDRKQERFWLELEQRMRFNHERPADVHLEPYINDVFEL